MVSITLGVASSTVIINLSEPKNSSYPLTQQFQAHSKYIGMYAKAELYSIFHSIIYINNLELKYL